MDKSKIEQYSLMDPKVQSNPYPFYNLLHEHAPVYRMPETGMYIVTRYDDLRKVLLDHESFSNTFGESFFELQGEAGAALYRSILQEKGWDHALTLQRTDPPGHTPHRRLVERVFSRKRIKGLVPLIERTCHELIDSFIDRGECEFISEFAAPLPQVIVAHEIGIEADEIPRFKLWADALLKPVMYVMSEEEIIETANLEVELQHHLVKMFDERRNNPGDDLISILATALDDDGKPLEIDVMQNIMHQLISGGFETLTSGITHALWLLLRNPDQMLLLRQQPDLLQNFIDEALRLESPTQSLLRRATRDVEIGGTLIPKGSMVGTRYGAANHDAAKFPCPHVFDITRSNANMHLAFGAGVHFCVGRELARQELRGAFTALLSRLDNIELARALPNPPHIFSILLHTLKELPIRFRPRVDAEI